MDMVVCGGNVCADAACMVGIIPCAGDVHVGPFIHIF